MSAPTPPPTDRVLLPELYPRQHLAIYEPKRVSVIEASTKSGKTHGCIIWQAAQVLSDTEEGVHWWVAPVYPQARIAFNRAKKYIPRALYKANNTELSLTFVNGAVWYFKSAEKPDNLYGEDVKSAVVDEASRCREESWHAIRSTLTATRGRIRIIGNTKGRGTWFYRISKVAQAGADPEIAYHKLTAYDAVDGGVLDIEEVEAAKRQLPEHVFKELYLAEVADDGGNPFGIQHIEAALLVNLSRGAPVAWGWDVAKHQDWTVGIALDEHGNMCRFIRFQHKSHPFIQRTIAQETNAPAYIDSTGAGDSTLDNVLELRTHDAPPVVGFTFSARSKQQLLEALATAFQAGEIGIIDGPVKDELEIFEYKVERTGIRYAAPDGYGLHDDCVIALALAWKAYRDFETLRSGLVAAFRGPRKTGTPPAALPVQAGRMGQHVAHRQAKRTRLRDF